MELGNGLMVISICSDTSKEG